MQIMQSPSSSTRNSIQRGSPTSSSSNAHHSTGSMSGSSHTSSSASSRNPAHRRQVNLSTIEKSVTHLLIATKQLLETLTAWSRGNATEAQVSDVYVRLGSEFNIACRAFTAIGVETADLGNVPDALRTILESTLSQDASPASLDVYLPRIREIIINLLHGLKRKQSRLRQRQARENGDSSGSQRSSAGPPRARSNESLEDQITPPRSSSLPVSNRGGSPQGPPYPTSRGSTTSPQTHQSTASIIPPISTVPPVSPPPTDTNAFQAAIPPQYFALPPPPEPKDDPLTALQQSNALPRRASRRYSSYLGGKLGASPNGYSLPTSRYREPHDAIDTGRVRQPGGSRPGRTDTSPMKKHRISEEREGDTGLKSPETPLPNSPEEKASPSPPKDTELTQQPSLKVDTVGPPAPPHLVEPPADLQRPHDESRPKTPVSQDVSDTGETVRPGTATSQSSNTKEITVFLQIGRSTKKTVLPEGVDDLSLTSLRLLFISKFNYNPPAGEDFPEIYLQDPAAGVRYELEDLQDIKDRSVLCLNVEVLDEVKRHIDDGIGGLRKLVEGVKGLVDGQAAALQRVAERQEEAAKKIAELSVAPTALPTPPTASASPTNAPEMPPVDHSQQIKEIRDLRKDLAVLRQVYSSFVSDVNNSMTTIKSKAATVKSTAENASTIAAFKAAPGSGRAHVEEGKKTLGTDADNLVTRVDDLQDLVEELRKDVVQRGVRPLHRQLETVSKDLIQAKQELKRMSDYIKREKPKWKKVWERELEVVCDDQQFFNMQEELVSDLQDDLEKASQTFALVEQCTEQQVKASGPSGPRSASRGFQPTIDETIDVASVKGNVLNEVRALRPNHENRLEAIERAERLRQKELEGRVPEFKKELGKFVEEGKLKKAGGVEEAERLRKARDEQILKETWEAKKNGILRTAETTDEEEKQEELVTPDLATDSGPVADAEPPVTVTAST